VAFGRKTIAKRRAIFKVPVMTIPTGMRSQDAFDHVLQTDDRRAGVKKQKPNWGKI